MEPTITFATVDSDLPRAYRYPPRRALRERGVDVSGDVCHRAAPSGRHRAQAVTQEDVMPLHDLAR